MDNEITHIYPATSLQKGFISHALNLPDDDAYRIQVLFDYKHALNTDAYLKAWECCLLQYPILRTAFNWEEDIIQLVYKYGKLDYRIHDIRQLPTQNEKDKAIKHIQEEDRQQGFDLTRPSLIRIHLIKQTETHTTVLKTIHHSIADGWSEPVLLNSLYRYYHELAQGKIPLVKEDTAYLRTQEYISANTNSVQDYWKAVLTEAPVANDINPVLDTPIDPVNYKRLEMPRSVMLEIKGALYDQLKRMTHKEGITMSVMVQFVWHKFLQVYTNSLQTIVGTTLSGRDLPVDGIEESVGLYINTLPLIVNWEQDNSILSQLHQIQQRITEMNTHSFVELATLQKDGKRIFHSLFGFENYPSFDAAQDVLQVTEIGSIEKVDYPLWIMSYEDAATLVVKLTYDNKYITSARAEKHLSTLEHIFQQLIIDPEKQHTQISLLKSEEQQQMVFEWNATGKSYDMHKTVVDLFEEQATRQPNEIALFYEGKSMTYQQVNEQSNNLAEYLKSAYHVDTGDLIGMMLDRSEKVIISMLGILKAGAAYVCIDPQQPSSRKEFIIQDTAIKVLITQTDYLFDLEFYSGNIFAIDVELETLPVISQSFKKIIKSTDLAYVMYTSGTTGTPKGVMVEHGGMVNLVHNQVNCFDIKIGDKVLQFASFIFDASVSEIFTTMTSGGRLLILPNEVKQDTGLLLHYLEHHRVQVATLPPTLLSTIPYKTLKDLKTLIVAGEACSTDVMIRWGHGRRLINAYGPTENTVCATMHRFEEGHSNTTIGRPIANTQVYVLDRDKHPVPIGVAGELFIGGAGLSRGYLNRPELTAERFIDNPFATETDMAKGYTRLYKTGDLVKWLPDGQLEYLGRNDDQVKIRGFRIELGEIEQALLQVPGIQQACVLPKERTTDPGSSKYLAAYYVLDHREKPLTEAFILEQISRVLPEYMLPSALVPMDAFPLTINGKLNKRGFPDPSFGVPADTYVAPGNDQEAELCRIWQELLGLDQVGITDNFFKIGGNSILAIQASHRMSQALGYDIKVADLFKFNEIKELLQHTAVVNDDYEHVEKTF